MSVRNHVVVTTTSSGARRCDNDVVGRPARRALKINNATAGYEDNVVSWPSVEPAADYTAASLFAFALGGAGLG
jgi:hypothetical protein